ncbi:type III secretion system stator protein SctL [Hahella ganghwensis]|uniref:type III secretion system stator protein SctL n=1 Tax=Hahella ganghwensis TaxID=286420 RepID=UPI000371B104|nr:type III secretion system stator protein SctL [Hahella ganghwensis]
METLFSVIKRLPTAGVVPDSAILKASEYQSLHEAETLLEAAQKEAEDILANAKYGAEAELEKGYRDGLALARQESAERLITTKIRANQMMQMAETDLINLVKLSIEKLFGELDDSSKIVRLIQSGLSSMRNDYRVLIRVSPEMEARVRSDIPEVVNKLPGIEYFEVVADTRIPRDTYILEGDAGIIKGSISEQFDRLNELVESALAEPQ